MSPVIISISTDGGETFARLVDEGHTGTSFSLTLPAVISSAIVLKVNMYQTESVNDTVCIATASSAVHTPSAHRGALASRHSTSYDLNGRLLTIAPSRAGLVLSASEAGVARKAKMLR